jgi:hypothetical protein
MTAATGAEREWERYRYFARMESKAVGSPEVQRTLQSLARESLRRATKTDSTAAEIARSGPIMSAEAVASTS